VENRQCRILEKFASLGLKHLNLVDVRSSRGGLVKHLVELDSDQIKKIPKDFIVIPRQRKTDGKHSIWFESEGCDICNTILARDAFLVSGKNTEEGTIKYSFIVATFEEYKSIISTLETSGHTVTVLKIGSFEPKRGILTEKQQRLSGWL
jgi:hypothetical protein